MNIKTKVAEMKKDDAGNLYARWYGTKKFVLIDDPTVAQFLVHYVLSQEPVFAAEDGEFGARFGFHARDLEHAKEMLGRWNRYHSFTGSAKVTARPVCEDDAEYIRNGSSGDDFMKGFREDWN